MDRPYLAAGSVGMAVASFTFAPALYYLAPLPLTLRGAVSILGGLVGLRFLLRGLSCFVGARVVKFHDRDRLLEGIAWDGVASVLDAGCGPGLLAVGAAKKAPGARVVGLDIWDRRLESGNSPLRGLQNASVEGVGGRVEMETGDMRSIPFPDSSFDVVVSRAALNHLRSRQDRRRAVGEVARVLRPEGQLGLAIVDSWNLDDYRSWLAEEGVGVRFVSKVARYPPGFGFLRGFTGLTIVVGAKRRTSDPAGAAGPSQ